MSVNLLEMVRGLFSPQVESSLSNVLNESESGISKAIAGVIPAVFGGLINKSSTQAGAADLFGMATSESENSIFDHIGGLIGGNDEAGILGKGAGLLQSLFGNKSNTLIDTLSNYAGIKPSSSKSLLSMALPAILGFIGKYIKTKGLDIGGLANLLNRQRPNVQAALPAGLNLSDFTGIPSAVSERPETNTIVNPGPTQTVYREVEEEESSGTGLKWMLPVLLLALLAAAALYFYKGCNNKAEDPHIANEHSTNEKIDNTATNTAVGTTTVDPASLGNVDEHGQFVYNPGNITRILLPGNGDSLQVGENSTEARLIAFLQSSEKVDTAKGNWFNFTNVRFVTGESEIQETSIAQLKNLVAITKAFPKAQFKIGGYTDNTGDSMKNLNLSKERAAAVLEKLKELGASVSSITGSDGYGSMYPIGDNNTLEGRALNRRVAVNVKVK